MSASVATRVPISLRLPAEIMGEIDAYANKSGIRKTDAFLHFLQRGIDSERENSDYNRLAIMESRIDEILAIVKDANGKAADQTLEDVQSAVAVTAANYPAIQRVYVFGSIARGDANAESDIDLRLEIDRNEKFNLHDLEHFCKSVEQKTGRDVDAVTSRTIKNKNLVDAIERDKVLIYERKKH